MYYKLISNNKIIRDLKNCKIRIFVRIFGAIKGWLGVFRGALRVPNFFVTSLCVRNCIPVIKLLAISKTVEIDIFLSNFEGECGWLNAFRILASWPILL